MADSDFVAGMKTRFQEATKMCAEIQARSKPLRDKRDAVVAKLSPLMDEKRALGVEIKEIEKPMFDLQNDIAAISRALKGHTGPVGR
jgi:predicted  nucleic acid-binding Zn-ribbon protein